MDDRKRVLTLREPTEATTSLTGVRIGTVHGTDAKGRFLVEFTGEATEHAVARITSSAKKNLLQSGACGQEVLVAFDEESFPIIVDTLHPSQNEQDEASSLSFDDLAPEEVEAVRKRFMLEAEDEIVLQCGDASITLTSAGKVLIKGNYVVSRSSGTNSIKGSSVRIN